jgi:hypothetical protein
MIIMGMRPVDLIALVTIPTFHPTAIFRDRQPDTRMTKRTFAAIAGDFPFGHDLGFWGSVWHAGILGPKFGVV